MRKSRLMVVIVTLAVSVIVLPLALLGLREMWDVEYDVPDRSDTVYYPELIFVDAPEGTRYVDPLVRIGTDDENYIEFAAPPQRAVVTSEYGDWEWLDLGVNEDSEITRLCEDGFVSLSQHYSRGLIRFNFEGRLYLEFAGMNKNVDTNRIFERYGGYRAAYVDERGNVLGITKPAVRVYDSVQPTAFIADGDELTFRVHGLPKWRAATLYAITIAEFVLIAALIVLPVIVIMKKLYSEQ